MHVQILCLLLGLKVIQADLWKLVELASKARRWRRCRSARAGMPLCRRPGGSASGLPSVHQEGFQAQPCVRVRIVPADLWQGGSGGFTRGACIAFSSRWRVHFTCPTRCAVGNATDTDCLFFGVGGRDLGHNATVRLLVALVAIEAHHLGIHLASTLPWQPRGWGG
eukprot:scaffold179_cov368-Prasinococcus_capsulatus_cf.AAC.45